MAKLTKKWLLVVLAIALVLTLALVACKQSATVTFVGGDGAQGTAPEAMTAIVGEQITLPQNTFTKQGHVFAGWKIGDATFSAGDKYTVESNAEAIAQWTKQEVQPETWTVTFKNGASTVKTVQLAKGGKLSATEIPDGPTAPQGKVFDGWYVGEGANAAKLTTDTAINSDVTANAKFVDAPVQKWTVTLKVGDTVERTVQVENGNKLTAADLAAPSTIATGMEFKGWFVDTTIQLTADTAITSNVTAVANIQAKQYNVTFDPNNGGATWSATVSHGQNVTKPAQDPVHSNGKTFRYWKTESGEYNFNTPVTGNLELTAAYAYKVTFVAGTGATGSIDPIWVTVWSPASLRSLPDATGLSCGSKVFAGWNDGETTYQAGDAYFKAGLTNVTFTAQWEEPTTKFTLTFTLGNGQGTPPAARQLDEGETTVLPDGTGLSIDQTDFPNYVFLGWSLKWNSEILAAGSTYTMPAQNVSLQARWGEQTSAPDPTQKYTVTYVKSSIASQINSVVGTLPQPLEAAQGSQITTPASDTLTLAHYSMTSWRVYVLVVPSDGGDAYWTGHDPAINVVPGQAFTMIGQNVQLRAVWTANKVTVNFDANGGSGTMPAVTNKDFNSSLFLPQTCNFTAPDGKEFAGWSTSANGSLLDGGLKLDANVVAADDTLTIYAIWKNAAVVPTTPLIDRIAGSWTATGHTLDVVEATDATNKYIKGFAILDGKHLLTVMDNEGTYIMVNNDSYDIEVDGEYVLNPTYIGYVVAESSGNLTLTAADESVLTLTSKTELVNADRADFVANWSRVTGRNPSTQEITATQPWIITATDVYYNASLTKTAVSIVIGNRLAILYRNTIGYSTFEYSYVLEKDGSNLEGWYKASDKAPAATTFVPATYLTLTVEGELNQIVNSGSAPVADKIVAPEAPDGQVFSKWVLAGTETEFDVTATMTESVSITAVFVEGGGTQTSGQTYVGNCLVKIGSGDLEQQFTVSKFVIDFVALTGKVTIDGVESDITLTAQNPVPAYVDKTIYGEQITYYELAIKYGKTSTTNYIIVNADKTKFTLCDNNDEPYGNGEFSLSDSDVSQWKALNNGENSDLYQLCKDGDVKLYFEEPFTYGTTKFYGILFNWNTNLSQVRIKGIYDSNGVETIPSSALSNPVQSNENPYWLVYSSTKYEIVLGEKTDGKIYVVSFKYGSGVASLTPDTTERVLLAKTSA